MNYIRINHLAVAALTSFCLAGCSTSMEENETTPHASVLAVTTTNADELPSTLGVYVVNRTQPEQSVQNLLFTSRNGQYESTLSLPWGEGSSDMSITGYGPYTAAQPQGGSILVNTATNQQTEESYRNANLVWGQQTPTGSDKIALTLQHKMSKLLIEVQYPATLSNASDEYAIEQMRLSEFQTSASFFPLQGTFGDYRSCQGDILPFGTGCNYRAFVVPQQPQTPTCIHFAIRQKSTGRSIEQMSYLSFTQTQNQIVSGQAYKVTLKVSADFTSSLRSRAAQQIVSEVKVCEWASGAIIPLPTDQGDWLTSFGDRYGGQGTLQQPHLLRTAKDLADFAKYVNEGNSFSSKYISLDKDIDCTGEAFTPIGTTIEKPFRGQFNGNHHVISGIRYEQKLGTGTVVAGLFGWCKDASIEKVTVAGSFDIEATTCYAGGIVACATATTVDGCENNANLTVQTNASAGVGACVGGLVGDAAVSVSGCINRGKIVARSNEATAKSYVAGIQGRQSIGTVLIACVNHGVVTATGAQVTAAGLTAQALGNVTSSYSLGAISGEANAVALLSADETTTGTYSYCFFNKELTSLPAHRIPNATSLNPKGVYGMTTSQLQNQFAIDDLNQGIFDWNKKMTPENKCDWRFVPTIGKWPEARK